MTSPRQRGAAPLPPAVAVSPDRATARERREREGAVVSRQLARTLVDHDVTHGQLAAVVGRSRAKVQQLTDPEQPDAYSVGDMRLSPPEVAADMARCGLEPHGFSVVRAHHHDTVEDDLLHLADFSLEVAALEAHVMRSCADGSWSAAEAAQGIRRIDGVMESLEAQRARLVEAIEKRVSPIRRGGSKPS